jgi:transposase InsO family protein
MRHHSNDDAAPFAAPGVDESWTRLPPAPGLAHRSARGADGVHRGAYSWPRIWRDLVKRGIRVGKQRVQRLMQKHGIRARGKRRFRVATTDSRHDLPMMFGRTRMIGYCNVSSGALPNTFRDHIESVRPINTGKRRSRQFRPIEVFPHALGLVLSVSGEGRRALCAGREI